MIGRRVMPLQRNAIAILCTAGLLVVMAVQAADEQAQQSSVGANSAQRCRLYSGPPAGPYHNNLTSTIAVSDEFKVGSATVELNIKHRRIGALRVQLVKTNLDGEPVSSTLKEDRLGGLGDDMTKTVFDERATDAFPSSKDEAPFTGMFQPSGNLEVFRGVDSLGVWLLKIQDVKPNPSRRPILLDNWQLTLCDSKSKSDSINSDSGVPVEKSTDELVGQIALELAKDVEEVFWEAALNRTQQSTAVHGFDGPSIAPVFPDGETEDALIPQSSNQALATGSTAGEPVTIRPVQQPFPNTLNPSPNHGMPTAASQRITHNQLNMESLENGQESSSADSISSSDKTDALASGIATQVLDALAAGPPPVQDTLPAFDPQESTDPPPVRAMGGPSHHKRVLPPGPWPYASSSLPAGGYGSDTMGLSSLSAASRALPGGVSPLPFVQAFRDYGSTYQAGMTRVGTQIGGVVATDYLLKEKLYGILLAPTTASPKARLHKILGLLRQPEYKFVRMQFAMAALSTGYLLHLAEKKGTFHHASSLYKEVLGDIYSDYGDILDDIHGYDKIKDVADHMKKAFPAGKLMTKAAAGKVKAMGRQFADEMYGVVRSGLQGSHGAGSQRMQDMKEPEDFAEVMRTILTKSLFDSTSVVADVQRILELSDDGGGAPGSAAIFSDYPTVIKNGLQAMIEDGPKIMQQLFDPPVQAASEYQPK